MLGSDFIWDAHPSECPFRQLIQKARQKPFRHGKRDEMVYKRPAGSLLHYLLPLLRLVPRICSRKAFFRVGHRPPFFLVLASIVVVVQPANMLGLFRSAT